MAEWVVVVVDVEGRLHSGLGDFPEGEDPCLAVVPAESLSREVTSRDVLTIFVEYDRAVGETPEMRYRQLSELARLLTEHGFDVR